MDRWICSQPNGQAHESHALHYEGSSIAHGPFFAASSVSARCRCRRLHRRSLMRSLLRVSCCRVLQCAHSFGWSRARRAAAGFENDGEASAAVGAAARVWLPGRRACGAQLLILESSHASRRRGTQSALRHAAEQRRQRKAAAPVAGSLALKDPGREGGAVAISPVSSVQPLTATLGRHTQSACLSSPPQPRLTPYFPRRLALLRSQPCASVRVIGVGHLSIHRVITTLTSCHRVSPAASCAGASGLVV